MVISCFTNYANFLLDSTYEILKKGNKKCKNISTPKKLKLLHKKSLKSGRKKIQIVQLSSEEKLKKQEQLELEDRQILEYFKMECGQCLQTFENYLQVKLHFRKAHNNIHAYISCCGKKFNRRGSVLEHIKWHTNPDSFK